MVVEDIGDEMEDLGTADTVFHAGPFAGDRLVGFLLSGGEFTSTRFPRRSVLIPDGS